MARRKDSFEFLGLVKPFNLPFIQVSYSLKAILFYLNHEMMKKILIVLPVIICALTMMVDAYAQTISTDSGDQKKKKNKPSPDKIINRFDTDGDGAISKTEAENPPPTRVALNFDRWDTNDDGQVTAQEIADAKPPTSAEAIKMMDTDGDGKISKSETRGRLADHFDEVDANKDRFLTVEELDQHRQQRQQQRQQRDTRN